MDMYGQPSESIYSIIPPKEIKVEKPPMYRSMHSARVPPTASTFGHTGTSHPKMTNIAGDVPDKVVGNLSARSMGKPPGSHQPDPQTWLKKNERSSSVPPLAKVRQEQPHLLQPSQLKVKNKPAVVKKGDVPVLNLVTSKNFVVANAVETILAAPKKTCQGAKDYLKKEDYGKVPKYLGHIKQDIEAEYDYIRQLQAQEAEMQSSQARLLTDEEKGQLIMGLKSKWEQVNTDYQATTHLTKLDTIGKVKRKEKYEAELSQIEKDIAKLNRKHIYVDPHA